MQEGWSDIKHVEIALGKVGMGALVSQWASVSEEHVGYYSICKVRVPLPWETRLNQPDQKHSNSGIGDDFMANVFSLLFTKTPVLWKG